MFAASKLPLRFANAKPGGILVSALLGLDVHNRHAERHGQIKDLSFENGNFISGGGVHIATAAGIDASHVLLDPHLGRR